MKHDMVLIDPEMTRERMENIPKDDIRKMANDLRKRLHPDKRSGLPISDKFEKELKLTFQFVHDAIEAEKPPRARSPVPPPPPSPGPPPGQAAPGPAAYPPLPRDVPDEEVERCYQHVIKGPYVWIKCMLCSTSENERWVDGTHLIGKKHRNKVGDLRHWLPR